jgi:hypothetical protein
MFLLSEVVSRYAWLPPPVPPLDLAVLFTTYHLLLVMSCYSVLLCLLMLGNFGALPILFVCAATAVDGLEGYLRFLPCAQWPKWSL